jgi:hypothetical protein
MGNHQSITNNTMVGPYKISDVRVFNPEDYPGGEWVSLPGGTRYYDGNYYAMQAHDKFTQKRIKCMQRLKQAVIDNRIDILDDIYSKKDLIGYIELNEPLLPLTYSNFPLMYEAAKKNNIEAVRWLLDKGVPDHSTSCIWGKTALDVTTSQEIKDLIKEKNHINMMAYEKAKEFRKNSFTHFLQVWLIFLS